MLYSCLTLFLSLILLILAADKFVTGSTGLAKKLNISPLIIGLTVVAIGTSAPEMFVSTLAALEGKTEIALGNAIGSNIANIGLILGMFSIIHPLNVDKDVILQDLPILSIGSLIITIIFYYIGMQATTGIILTLAISAYLYFMVRRAKAHKDKTESESELLNEINSVNLSVKKSLLYILLGIILLPICSHYLVESASTIARYFGISDLIIGLTIVAAGTSLPELAACAAGIYRKEYGLAIGNIVGSNIFNLTGVLAPAAFLSNSYLPSAVINRDLPIMFLLITVLYLFSINGKLNRIPGFVLLSIYVFYIYFISNI